jgi:hypothetical protein
MEAAQMMYDELLSGVYKIAQQGTDKAEQRQGLPDPALVPTTLVLVVITEAPHLE